MGSPPVVPESFLWMAELDFIARCDRQSRTAQFAIRTAERALCLARAAGTDPVDELLDARGKVATARARRVLERAIGYVRADQELSADLTERPVLSGD
jgi:hypothetical protein